MIKRNTNFYQSMPTNYKFHLLNNEELEDVWVSSHSRWHYDKWRLDVASEVAGTRADINWRFPLNDGGYLTDVEHSFWLDYFKRLTWSLFVDRRDGRQLSTTTSSRIQQGLKRLVPWIIQNNLSSPLDFTPDAIDEFIADLFELIEAESSDEKVTEGPLIAPLWVIELSWTQSEVFKGIYPSPKEHPLRGITSNKFGTDMATKARGWIPPIPDVIATRILQKAIENLESPIVDSLVMLMEDLIDIDEKYSEKNKSLHTRLRTDLIKETIKLLPEKYKIKFKQTHTTLRSEIDGCSDPTSILRLIFVDIATSCTILIQALTGMRTGELCSLVGTLCVKTGLPSCVVRKKSKSGLLDIYYLKAKLKKTLDAPEEYEWVAGCCLHNSHEIPLAIKAAILLQRLYSPWTKGGRKYDLWFTFNSRRSIPYGKSGLARPTVGANSSRLKDFTIRNIDLSDIPDVDIDGTDLVRYKKSKGAIIRAHQWRKSFAIWLFRYDSNLIAAISEQFKHLSLAMTEEGYLGNDPLLLEALDATRTQETVNFFYEASMGKRSLAGGMAKRIELHIESVKLLVDKSNPELSKQRIQNWVVTNNVRIHFAEHGKCLMCISPGDSRCNKISGTDSWANINPNFVTRSPDLCGGCDCFVIDKGHAKFWTERYTKNSKSWKEAKLHGMEEDYKISQVRASQAKQVLNVLGLKIPTVEVECGL
jgi:integrase